VSLLRWAAGGCWAAVESRPAEGAAVDFGELGRKQPWAKKKGKRKLFFIFRIIFSVKKNNLEIAR
jgi:hypothetical protein